MGEVLTGRLALAQQQLAHLPEKPSQRLGDGKDGWTVAGVGWQPVRSETLRVSTLLRLLGFCVLEGLDPPWALAEMPQAPAPKLALPASHHTPA